MDNQEGWDNLKDILIILAHPDDPEFFLGGSIARWVKAGHHVRYLLLTRGDKGANDKSLSPQEIIEIRIKEQQQAAQYLGVASVDYLNYEDGYLIPDLEMRKKVVAFIRKYQPHIVVTCDPTNFFPSQQYINHPDHRNAGQVVVDAVFPAVGNPFFFPELMDEGLMPHAVEELWMSLTNQPDIRLNLTPFWDIRLEALKKHASQIGDPIAFEEYMLMRVQNEDESPFKYEESFRRIIFRR